MIILFLIVLLIAASWKSSHSFVIPGPATFRHSTVPEQFSTTSSETDSTSRADLPDIGKSAVEVDQIRLSRANAWRRKDLFGNSLLDQTLQDIQNDKDFQEIVGRNAQLGPEKISKEERENRRRALDALGVPNFFAFVDQKVGKVALERKPPTVLQLNIGLYCNQACGHCHVESSPLRKDEMMSAETAAQCLQLLEATPSIKVLDITGGAPELNANFRYLVHMARAMRPDLEIIDRCNLTVLQEPGQEDLVDFLKENKVRIVASLPCYGEENVDKQRGKGVFVRSIAALLALNEAGYGVPGSDLKLDLVYNPGGAFLPSEQGKLEVAYKEVLDENFGILFNSLLTITNMPIKRFADFLHRRGELKQYMDLLVSNFNVDALPKIMCLDIVSVGYDGRVYDCDFNQQLGYTVGANAPGGAGLTVFEMENLNDLLKYKIRTDYHCYGCTAGQGSSCQGATAV